MLTLKQAKARASRIADHAEATSGGPYFAAEMIMKDRLTNGNLAALLAGLVVGALCERGKAEAAQSVTEELAELHVRREDRKARRKSR